MAWVSTRLTLITSTLYVIHTALPSDPSAVPTQSCSETPTPPSQTTDPATSQQIPSSAITKSNPEDLSSTAASLSQSSEPLLLHAEDWPPDSPTGSVLPELAASTAARPSRPLLITTILLIPLITL
jgi:hypothetical protein